MKARILILIFFSTAVSALAQTVVDKALPVSPSQRITMQFDYPKLIRVTTWEKNQVSIQGTVSINGGENDDAFELITSSDAGIITIRNEIKNMAAIPKVITANDGPAKIVFRSNEALKKYEQEYGKIFESKSWGIDMEIQLEIKVPRNIETHIESTYGMVEVKDFAGPLTVKSTYGGIDAALDEPATGELSAETNYGEIYTNFAIKFNGKGTRQDFYTFVSAKPGAGPRYSFTSNYGNVYIRKSK